MRVSRSDWVRLDLGVWPMFGMLKVETGESLCAKECASGIDFVFSIYTQFLPICGHPISSNMRRAQSKTVREKRSKYLGVIANQGLPRNTWKETHVEQLKIDVFHFFPTRWWQNFTREPSSMGSGLRTGELANSLGLYRQLYRMPNATYLVGGLDMFGTCFMKFHSVGNFNPSQLTNSIIFPYLGNFIIPTDSYFSEGYNVGPPQDS